MSKTKRRRRGVERVATVDVVTQLECAVRHPQAAALGALIGGVVPWFARTLAHEEVPAAWASDSWGLVLLMVVVVLGCACFSALSVYKFGRAAFGDARKALGFVLALEGVMLVAHGATSLVALTILIVINALANGSVIALSREATMRRREADSRRSATRSRRTAGVLNVPTRPVSSVPVAPSWRASATAAATVPSTALVRCSSLKPRRPDVVIDVEEARQLFS